MTATVERSSSEAPARPEVLRLLQLSEDLLWEIVSILPISDASVLSHTCRSLYSLCTRHILTHVVVRTGNKLAGFTSYVLAEPETRLHWVRTLHVYTPGEKDSPHTNGLKALIEVLRTVRKHHLISFTMTGTCNWDGMWFDSFCAALSELPSLANLHLSLKHVQLSGNRPLWSGLQRTFAPGLRSLKFNILPIHPISGPEYTLALFRQMRSLQQLESLRLSGLNMSSSDNYNDVYWPTLRSLEVVRSIVSLPALSRMFPAVSTVKTYLVDSTDDAATGARIASWQRLDCLSAHKDDPTLTAVRCPVRTLELTCSSISGLSMTSFVPHIYGLRPFTLQLKYCVLDEVIFWHALADAMAAVGTRHLELEFRVRSSVSRCILDWANNVAHSLAQTSLDAIEIVALSTSPNAPVLDVQLEANAGEILAIAVPTLQCAAVKHRRFGMGGFDKETWWAIERENSATNTRTIRTEEGKRLMHETMLELRLQGSRS